MKHNFISSTKYVLGTIKSSFLPAFITTLALIVFYAQDPIEFGLNQIFHYAFLSLAVIYIIFLSVTNQSKSFYTALLGIISYLFINNLKREYGIEFTANPKFILLCFILPINLAILYFLPTHLIRSKKCLLITIFLLAEMFFVEHFNSRIMLIPYIDITYKIMPLLAISFWIICLTFLFINLSFKNTIINTGLFYADSILFLLLIYADNTSALTIFGLSFITVLLCVTLLDLLNQYHYDYLEKVSSYNTYILRANNKFLFKYTIAMFAIDNIEKIQNEIGQKNIHILEQMLINRITDIQDEIEIYRYNKNELMMVFKNEDAKHTLEYCDNIRRNIAASEFIFTSGKSVKITISICVSERTRKYIDAAVVAERGHNGLQKGCHFNSNIATIIN